MVMSALNRPGRAVIIVVELVLIAAAVIAAVLIWRGVNYQVDYVGTNGRHLVSSKMHGDLAGASIGLCLIAGFLFIDAIRQSILAFRPRGRRAEARELARYQQMLEQERTQQA